MSFCRVERQQVCDSSIKKYMSYSGLLLVIALSLCANVLSAAPRIIAQVDTIPEATLTAEEERAVSVAAGRLLRHAYDAKVALQAKKTKEAEEQIILLEKLVRIIENAVPSVTVKAKISSGGLTYQNENSIKPAIIPIHYELDMVSLAAPLHNAQTEESAKENSEASPIGVIDHEIRDIRVTLDLELAKAGLQTTKEKLAAGDIEAAQSGLAVILHHSLQFITITADVPLHRAQENLMLAKEAIEQGNRDDARVLLAEVAASLNTYEQGAEKNHKKSVEKLHTEIMTLSDSLANGGAPDKGFSKTIESWWDRISELMD